MAGLSQSSTRSTRGAFVVLALGFASPSFAVEAPASCPSQPTRVVRSVGDATDDVGTVPGIPDLCRMQRPDGTADYGIGSWRSDWRSDWPGAGLAYPAIRTVLHSGPGTRASVVTRSYPGQQFTGTFIHEGPDPLTIGGVRYATIKLAPEREGIEGNTYHPVITSWRDTGTGIVLKIIERRIAGVSYGPNTTWVAARVERLP